MEEKIFIYISRFRGECSSEDLTRTGLGRYLKENRLPVPEGNVEIVKSPPYQKPCFKDLPGIFHNVSHSGNWWACAYGRIEMGLDLQQTSAEDKSRLAERFFHPLETAWLGRQPADQFYRIWAYKESYVKYTGEGLSRGLDRFSVVGRLQKERDGEYAVSGASGVCQQEIPFPEEDYRMVLTTKEPVNFLVCRL